MRPDKRTVVRTKKRKMKRKSKLRMSRQDTTIIDPDHGRKMVEYCQQLEYMTGFVVPNKPKILPLHLIKKAVEMRFDVLDIAIDTNRVPFPDARKIFVKIAADNYPRHIVGRETNIMDKVKRSRAAFYHNIRQANNLLDTDKDLKEIYDEVIEDLKLLPYDVR